MVKGKVTKKFKGGIKIRVREEEEKNKGHQKVLKRKGKGGKKSEK